jgi:hypothetical protein
MGPKFITRKHRKLRKLEVRINIFLTLMSFLLPFTALWIFYFAAAGKFDIDAVFQSSAYWLGVILYELTVFPHAARLLWRVRA